MQTEANLHRFTPQEQEVWQVIEAFNRAFAANDSERYFEFKDEELSVLTPSNPYRIDGLSDDREGFEHGIRVGHSTVGYFQELQPRVSVYEVAAVVTYFSRGSYGADTRTVYLKETDVLVKKNGSWKIVHIHVSATH
jgi:ketosteroid isomerase-like protein